MPRVDGGFDFVDELFPRDQPDVEAFVARAFGRHLVFDMERGDTGFLELADAARHVHGVAITRFAVTDDGNIDGVDDLARLVDHFGEREQAGVGKAERAMLAAAGNMDQWKAEPFDQPRLNAVIAARSEMTDRFLQHGAQGFAFFCCGKFHLVFSFPAIGLVVAHVRRATAGRPYVGMRA